MATDPTIAHKLIAKLKTRRRKSKASTLAEIIGTPAGHNSTMPPEEALFPGHAVYVNAHRQVSELSERLSAMKAMAPFVEMFAEAVEAYMPGGPPLSPLTWSYFLSWAFFDALLGGGETIGTILMDLASAFRVDAELLRIVDLM